MRINTLARLLLATHPELAQAVQEKYKPVMTDYKHIPRIHEETIRQFPELDDTDRKILFVAAAYQMYCPASMIPAAGVRASPRFRQELCQVLGYDKGPNVNRWKSMACAYIKQPGFKKKVEQLTQTATSW